MRHSGHRSPRLLGAAGLGLAGVALVMSTNCGSSDDATSTAQGGAAGQGGGVGGSFSGPTGSGGEDVPPCAEQSLEANLEQLPVDIIFVVGNNGSMAQEIAAVEANINVNFAQVIENSGVDYRVIMVSKSGSHQFNVCVEAPLGGVPAGECAIQPNDSQPINTAKFFHYSAIVNSDDAWCKLLSTYDGSLPDEYGLAPNGWSEWLRPGTAKVFVVLSDSSLNCGYMGSDLDDGPQSPSTGDIAPAEAEAVEFDSFLLGLSAADFGTETDRQYVWHSIVGLEAKDLNNPVDPWLPGDPLTLNKCSAPGGVNAVSPALGYQALSRLSNGLRFPVCEFANFDVVFNTIAQGIIDGALIACDFAIPEPPPGETVDLDTLEIEFTPEGGATQVFTQVADASECTAESFFIQNDRIILCPDACTAVQAETDATLRILYSCEMISQ